MLRVMHRSVWLALAAVLAIGLLGGFLLSRALQTTDTKPKPSLVPPGAKVVEDRPLGGTVDQRVVTWRIGGHAEEPASGLYGVTIWRGKERLYTHRARTGAAGIYVETGDFTTDGRDDVLLFDDTGGSGGCGVYRALTTSGGRFRQVLVRFLCVDKGSIHLRPNALVFRFGEQEDPNTANDIHCCFMFVRTTVKRWNGDRFVVFNSSRKRLPRLFAWPPGDTAPGSLRYCLRPGGPGNYLAASWSVPCRIARQVEATVFAEPCSGRTRCIAGGFTCLALWEGRYDRPFDYTHHAMCRDKSRRVEMDEG
jgi:hypothetical protein